MTRLIEKSEEREQRSSIGAKSLLSATLQRLFGLSSEMSNFVYDSIRRKGELNDMNAYVRSGLNGTLHKRFNKVLDMVQSQANAEKTDETDEIESEKPQKEEMKEGKMTFMQALLDESEILAKTSRFISQDKRDYEEDELKRMSRNPRSADTIERRAAKRRKDENPQKEVELRNLRMRYEKQRQAIEDKYNG